MDQTLLIIFIAAIVLFILKGLMTEARNQRNETRRCPRCGSVIPYKARVCPACWNGINGRGLKTDWAAAILRRSRKTGNCIPGARAIRISWEEKAAPARTRWFWGNEYQDGRSIAAFMAGAS